MSDWLGRLRFACWDDEREELREVGRMFSGLTDAKLREITQKLEPLVESVDGRTADLRPEIVIEVEYEEIQASTDDAVETIEETTARVETGAETIEAGLGAFGDVVEAVDEANGGVQSISTAADDQAASAEEVVAMADEVATVSEGTASEAQTVSAAAEEQSASLTQVSREVERLSDRAGELERLASQFETGDVANSTPSERRPSPEGRGSAVATDGGPASE